MNLRDIQRAQCGDREGCRRWRTWNRKYEHHRIVFADAYVWWLYFGGTGQHAECAHNLFKAEADDMQRRSHGAFVQVHRDRWLQKLIV
jgi:hypothetical protein